MKKAVEKKEITLYAILHYKGHKLKIKEKLPNGDYKLIDGSIAEPHEIKEIIKQKD